MVKTSTAPTPTLRKRKAELIKKTVIPLGFLRASVVRQFLTCGKKNCRCRRGFKHGPFYYLVQSQRAGGVRKFLLKTPSQRAQARAAIASHDELLERLENLSEINTELLRRGELLMDA